MAFLTTIKKGLMIINPIWFGILTLRFVFKEMDDLLLQVAILVIVILIFAYTLGEFIEWFETLYLKGKLLSSGKYTIDKE